MNVRDVMTARPRCAAPDTPLSRVAELMETEDVGAIPILDGDRLVGMITDRDIVVRAVAKDKDPRGMPSREISSGELVTVGPDQDLSDALHLMAQHQVRRLPVVDARGVVRAGAGSGASPRYRRRAHAVHRCWA